MPSLVNGAWVVGCSAGRADSWQRKSSFLVHPHLVPNDRWCPRECSSYRPVQYKKIDNDNWELNTTFVNKNNEYDPINTVNYRINCSNLTTQQQGWRIGSTFIDYTNEFGMKAANGSTRKIKSGTVDKVIYDFVCGTFFPVRSIME